MERQRDRERNKALAVAARSKAHTVFDRSNTALMASNPGTTVSAIFSVCVVLCRLTSIEWAIRPSTECYQIPKIFVVLEVMPGLEQARGPNRQGLKNKKNLKKQIEERKETVLFKSKSVETHTG